jgi:hypothetical protein
MGITGPVIVAIPIEYPYVEKQREATDVLVKMPFKESGNL